MYPELEHWTSKISEKTPVIVDPCVPNTVLLAKATPQDHHFSRSHQKAIACQPGSAQGEVISSEHTRSFNGKQDMKKGIRLPHLATRGAHPTACGFHSVGSFANHVLLMLLWHLQVCNLVGLHTKKREKDEEEEEATQNLPLLFASMRLAMPISVAYFSSLRRMRPATLEKPNRTGEDHPVPRQWPWTARRRLKAVNLVPLQ